MSDEAIAWFTADEWLILCRSICNLIENEFFDVGEPIEDWILGGDCFFPASHQQFRANYVSVLDVGEPCGWLEKEVQTLTNKLYS